jgi:hypothetical protein
MASREGHIPSTWEEYARETPQKDNENYRLMFKAYSHLKKKLNEAVFGGSSQVNWQYTRETSLA